IVSQEAFVDGKKRDQVEFQIYGLMVDPTELKVAESVERQDQWTIKTPKTEANFVGGVERVRSINKGQQYIRTLKVKTPSGRDKEIENDSSRDEFEFMAKMADQGMIKDRFSFPTVSGMVYEVDVFLA